MVYPDTISGSNFFLTGGTLPPNSPSYVERQADRDLYQGLLQSNFCYVLTSRQMGKSSLMARTAARLREHGSQVVALDLTAIGQNLTPDQWYDGLVVRMGQQLDLEDELEEFWLANFRLSPVQRFFTALRNVALAAAPKNARTANASGPLVIFVDEIDTVRSLPFSTDEFFAAIRECYNRRSEDSDFNRLTFCLLGVAQPADLMRDAHMTPFNIGQRIELNDFTYHEAELLAVGLCRPEGHGPARDNLTLLERVLHWTNGHPYLTQRLCQAINADRNLTQTHEVDRLCEDLFLSNRARERDDNLLYVRERILRTEQDLASVLRLYDQIHHRQRIYDDETNPLIDVLRLAGIIRVEKELLVVRNRIYHRVFDSEWVAAHMPPSKNLQPKAIAVLPFLFVGPDREHEYLSDGLTEELIDALGKTPGLRVASRTSAFQFKGQAEDVRKIGTQLNVDYVLEGSVRMMGDRIRVSAQFVNVADGYRLWSDTYKYRANDLFLIQDEIAFAIVTNLKSELGLQKNAPPSSHPAENLEAYNLYLKGRYYWNKRTDDALKRSVVYFQDAIEKDPHCALAYAGLADAYSILGTYNFMSPLEAYPRAKAAATTALELDDNLAQAYTALGCVSCVYEWNWSQGEIEFRRAIALNPSYTTARAWYAINCLTPLGRATEAVAQLRQAQGVDPLSISINASIGLAFYYAGQYDAAIEQYHQTTEMDASFWLTYLFQGWAYLQRGMVPEATSSYEKAIQLSNGDPATQAALGHLYAVTKRKAEAHGVLERLTELAKTKHVPPTEVGMIYLGLGDVDRCLECITQATHQRSIREIYLKVDPRLDALRNDRRFCALIRQMGLDHDVS